ncbi:MAG: hypothetical protein EA359_16390 [Balneolaceae bacterium]|nr:MAG: hypothetical protein EA359_16390 [Balneolaceae bacterium]
MKNEIGVKFKKLFSLFGLIFAGVLLTVNFSTNSFAQDAGLTPGNFDGFETADWRNFRPNYIGSSTEFIRPRFEITNENPVSGKYSLRWTGGDLEHEWLMLSNAFYLARPFSATVLFRSDDSSNSWRAGFYLMQDYDFFSGVILNADGAAVQIDAEEWDTAISTHQSLEAGQVYRLTIALDQRNRFTATVTNHQSGAVLFEKSGISAIEPGAIALYVKTDGGSNSRLYFDDITVQSADYYIETGTWSRAPQPYFVALERLPDVTQEEGNWVGGHSVMKTEENEYLIWYRVRDNVQRGKGYGFARSSDGIQWEKYENNPVFVPDRKYDSNEKITVLKVDGMFRGWYTVEHEGLWITKHIQSRDGIHWENDVPVIDDMMCKDADVVYLDGKYFLYCIGPANTEISVYTSGNGLEWKLREVYEMGTHRHLAVYFERENSRFALYPSAGAKGVSYAASEDGIRFEPFTQTWAPPAVGLDDWVEAGITYLSFLRNEHGHIQTEDYLPVYYQARNTYDNNIPGWLYHGGERVVLAGKFEGLFMDIATRLMPDGTYQYGVFPFEIDRVKGLSVFADRESILRVNSWKENDRVLAEGVIESQQYTLIQFSAENLGVGDKFELLLSGETAAEGEVQSDGKLILRTIYPDDAESIFQIRRK